MQTVLCWSTSQLAEEIGDVFLLVDAEVVLGCAKEDNTSFADGDGKVTELIRSVRGVEHGFQGCCRILAADDGSDIEILEVSNAVTFS